MRRARGYSEVLAGTLIDGSIGTLVVWATMPASMLVALRMVFAALTLGVVVAAPACSSAESLWRSTC